MSNMKIAWEKWEDQDQDEGANSAILDSEEEVDENVLSLAFLQQVPRIVSTPMGMYQFDDRMRPSKQFDCWIGHTNFDITEDIKNNLERVEGVEVLNILSRYRFFVGIAKLFDFRDVRIQIEQNICGYHDEKETPIHDEEVMELVSQIKKRLISENHWAIFIFPNGSVDYTSSDAKDTEFNQKVALYEYTKMYSGGVLIESKE